MTTNKRLITNFLSLSSVQALNYILPLITVPYLVRVLGPEKFGLISFAQAFIAYFVVLTDYGFNLSATREISIYRDDKNKVSEIFSSVIIIKIFLMLFSFLLLCLIVFSFSKFKDDWLIHLLTFGTVIGNVLFPVWFFQGMEKMKHISILNIIGKVIFTSSIFIFVRSREKFFYVPLINGIGLIFIGAISLLMVFGAFGLKFRIPPLWKIKHEFKEGWQVFIATTATSLYTTGNVFILGIFTNNSIVGFYSAGEKIVRAVLGLTGPLSQTIYPHISKLAWESHDLALTFVRGIVKIVGGATFLLSLLLLLGAPFICKLVLGKQFEQSIIVIQLLSFLPFFIGLGNIFGVQVMLNFGFKSVLTKIFLFAGAINIFLGLILVVPLKYIGISISVLFTEIFVTSSMFFFLHNKGFDLVFSKKCGK